MATCHVLPTLWFRNTWRWGREHDEYWPEPRLWRRNAFSIGASHSSFGPYALAFGPAGIAPPRSLFTNNETNAKALFGTTNVLPYVKDAFHELVVGGRTDVVNPANEGTKAAVWYCLRLQPGKHRSSRCGCRRLPKKIRL